METLACFYKNAKCCSIVRGDEEHYMAAELTATVFVIVTKLQVIVFPQ